jgi:hypothetical protein
MPENFSRRGRRQPRKHPQQRGFSAPGRAEECHDLPRHDFDISGRNNFNASAIWLGVKLFQRAPFENRLGILAARKHRRYRGGIGLRHKRIMNDSEGLSGTDFSLWGFVLHRTSFPELHGKGSPGCDPPKKHCHSERSEESLFDFSACKDTRRDSSLRSE